MSYRILVPLDGSPLSEAILPVVEALTPGSATEILLLHSLGPDDASPTEADARRRTDAYLAGVAECMKTRGRAVVRWAVWSGDPAQVIINAATRGAVTLIAMGTHGRDGVNRLRFGSVAETVVRGAPVPVLLVRGEFAHRLERKAGILVPLDGSGLSEAILPAVERLAGPLELPLELLHVIEPPAPSVLAEPSMALSLDEIVARGRAQAEAYLAATAARLAAKGLRASTVLREGLAVDVIGQYAGESGCGLIAMSTHGRSGVGRLVLGSVAEHVLRATSVPVLIWKAPTNDHASPAGAH